jgi:hypothetical protein
MLQSVHMSAMPQLQARILRYLDSLKIQPMGYSTEHMDHDT